MCPIGKKEFERGEVVSEKREHGKAQLRVLAVLSANPVNGFTQREISEDLLHEEMSGPQVNRVCWSLFKKGEVSHVQGKDGLMYWRIQE